MTQRDTRPLMIASAEELRSMTVQDALECVREALIRYVTSHQDMIERNAARWTPAQVERQRGIKEGFEVAAIIVGATIEHGFAR